jgi:deoxyribonuclease-1
MMRILLPIFLLIIFTVSVSLSQVCGEQIDTRNYDFGEIEIGKSSETMITIPNNGQNELTITDLRIESKYQFAEAEVIKPVAQPGESLEFKLICSPTQNVQHYGALLIEFDCGGYNYTELIELIATGYHPEYNAFYDLEGEQLLNGIKGYLQGHNVFTYKQSRIMLWSSFDNKDGIVECVYTGKTVEVGPEPSFSDLDQAGWNTEHTWPRSMGSDDEPPLSDMYHIYPTDKNANARRGNSPFGIVSGNIMYEEGGSKLGNNDIGMIVFEPRDKHKGNVARSLFYFATRYSNPDNFLNNQEEILRQWHYADPPDAAELERNDSIAAYQGRRNVFIDFPQIVERLPGIAAGGDFNEMDFVDVSDESFTVTINKDFPVVEIPVYFVSYGKELFTPESIEIHSPDIDYEIQVSETGTNFVKYLLKITDEKVPGNEVEMNLVFNSDEGENYEVKVLVKFDVSSIENPQPYWGKFIKIIPNPIVDESQVILLYPGTGNDVRLTVTDINGKELLDLTQSINWNSDYGEVYLNRNSFPGAGGTYFLNFESNGRVSARKLIIN